jgi:hypothetical protein
MAPENIGLYADTQLDLSEESQHLAPFAGGKRFMSLLTSAETHVKIARLVDLPVNAMSFSTLHG